MIKRSAVILSVLIATASTRNLHVHGSNHGAHVKAVSVQTNAASSTEIKVQGDIIPDVQNADVCSFYQDESFYVLKFIIAEGFNYNSTTALNQKVEFNICNYLNNYNQDPNHACYQSFACLNDGKGNFYALSGHTFKDDIRAHVDPARKNDSSKGGLSLEFRGGKTPCGSDPNVMQSLWVDLYCDEDGDRDAENDVRDVEFTKYEFDDCQIGMKLKSKHACYVFSLGPFFRYISKYYFLFGIGMIVMGLFVGFFGRKLIHPTICMIGTLIFVVLSSWLIFTLAFDRDSNDTG
jgi:hypothetical protein